MNRGKWEKIKELFEAASELEADRRETYLNSACADDPEMRREVESLLANYYEDGLLEEPAVAEVYDVIMNRSKGFNDGRKVGHYKILSSLGKGGMGEVYLAIDTNLHRKVAIKFLHEYFSRDSVQLNRFRQEAQAASALNHPNILTVYEIGKTENSNYIATEYIEGETLREHLTRKERTRLKEILKIGVQVAEALVAAHRAGIVHRDIKPENIMIRTDGYVKVLDFGLAKLTGPKVLEDISLGGKTEILVQTNPGVVMGTSCYMSPEQAGGKETDSRTDIWSLGIVLYEMIAGRVPFKGETINHTIIAILEDKPKKLENVPEELQRIIDKALTKEKKVRYQKAEDLLIGLKNLRKGLDLQSQLIRVSGAQNVVTGDNAEQGSTADPLDEPLPDTLVVEAETGGRNIHKVTASPPPDGFARFRLRFFLIAAGLFLILGGYLFWPAGGTEQIDSIAVLPFQNQSGNTDSEHMSDGLTEELINGLSELKNLKVIARTTSFTFKGKMVEPMETGRMLNVRSILTGSLRRNGDRLTVQVDLIDTDTGTQIWGKSFDRNARELKTIKQEILSEIVGKLALEDTVHRTDRRRGSADPEAYELYMRGMYYFQKSGNENLQKAFEHFQQAIERDPEFTLAYNALASCYIVFDQRGIMSSNEAMVKARIAVDKALQIDDSSAETHTALALIYGNQWRWKDTEKELRKSIELNPNYSQAHTFYGNFLLLTGRFDQALEESRIAKELNPLRPSGDNIKAYAYLNKNEPQKAYDMLAKVEKLFPDNATIYNLLGWACLRQNRKREAESYFLKSLSLNGRINYTLRALGHFYAVSGRRDEALAIIKELEELYKERKAWGQHIAGIYAGLGDKDKAFEWLEKDFRERSTQLPKITYLPAFEGLRNDPRFADLINRIGL